MNMQPPTFSIEQFVDTRYDTAAGKFKAVRSIVALLHAADPARALTKATYDALHLHFSFIAHTDQRGFAHVWLSSPRAVAAFAEHLRIVTYAGDPLQRVDVGCEGAIPWTESHLMVGGMYCGAASWADVATAIAHHGDWLVSRRDHWVSVAEAEERSEDLTELARLQAKYGPASTQPPAIYPVASDAFDTHVQGVLGRKAALLAQVGPGEGEAGGALSYAEITTVATGDSAGPTPPA